MNIFISLKLTTQIEKPWIMRVLNHNLTRWLVTLIFIIGLILYFFLLPVSYSQSVWQRTGGPYGDTVYYIAVHPFSQDTIVAGNDEKLYLTTDGGKAWSLITSIPGYVLSLITVPTNPPAFYCGTEWQGIFLSLDSGKSWEKMSSMRALTFAFDPNNPERIFAGSDSGKILVTNDHGRNWKKINTGSDASIRSISVSPQDTNTIFAGTRGNFYDIGDGLYKTIDGGKTWQKKLSLNSSVTAIEIDPSNFFYIYVGSVEEGIFKSIDGGENWEETIDGLPEHIMIYSLLSNLDQTYHFFAGTDQGIYVKATDGNWSPFDIGVETSHFSTITKAHPESSNLFIGCPFGLLKGDVSSDKFHTIGVNFITISDILVDYHKPDVLFAIGRSIYKSTNSGVTWDLFNYGVLGPNQAGVIAIDPSNPVAAHIIHPHPSRII